MMMRIANSAYPISTIDCAAGQLNAIDAQSKRKPSSRGPAVGHIDVQNGLMIAGDGRAWNHNLHFHPTVLNAIATGATSALDVGTGDGMLAVDLRRILPDVVAIDTDVDVLAAPAHEHEDTSQEFCSTSGTRALGRFGNTPPPPSGRRPTRTTKPAPSLQRRSPESNGSSTRSGGTN